MKKSANKICCHIEPWAAAIKPSVAVPLAPVQVPSKLLIARVSHQSFLSANDKAGTGAVYEIPVIYLTTEENNGKPQPEDRR